MNLISSYCQKIWRKVLNKLFKINFLKRVFGFPTEKVMKQELRNLMERYKGERFFLFPSPSCPWGYMFQRPQQIAKALSKQGYLVLYSVTTDFPGEPDWSTRGLHRIDDNLYLFNDGVCGRTLREFADRMVVWQYWPHQAINVEPVAKEKTIRIMDCIDHVTTFSQYDGIEKDFHNSLSDADIVLATSNKILEDIQKIRRDTILVPNAVNVEDFQGSVVSGLQEDELEIVNHLIQLKSERKVIIGYYGALAEWVDFDMISEISSKVREWEFIFIGQKYPELKLPKADNIHYFKRVRYESLPNIVSYFDVAILPFKMNDITESTSPVKIFEYMAALKPIVSTALPEVKQYNSVYIANNTEEFTQHIKTCLHENNEGLRKRMIECSLQNTWQQRVELVVQALQCSNKFSRDLLRECDLDE